MTTKLYPKFTKRRKIMDLSGMWRFQLDTGGEGIRERWEFGLPNPDLVPVPSSFNDLYTDKDIREFAGDIWYETSLYVPTDWNGMLLDLYFSGVTNRASVYVNGQLVKEHVGGYTAFHASIQDVITHDQENKLVVKVSNIFDEGTLPFGRTLMLKDGTRMLKSELDAYPYAGIHRSVQLVGLPNEHITDFSVDFKLAKEDVEVNYMVKTNGKQEVKVEVRDENRQVVGEATGKENTIVIHQAKLWKPLNAYLYTFTIRIYQNENLLDEYVEEIGIRTVEVIENELYLNGEPIYLKGFYRLEDSALHGAGTNLPVLKRDLELMKWTGANCVSAADFPYGEEFYQMADREGILVIDTLPASGLRKIEPSFVEKATGQVEEHPFFERESVQTITKQAHLRALKEVIVQHKNHACVIAWNLMTEPDATDEHIKAYAEEIFETAHQLDPQQRPRTALLQMGTLPGECWIAPFCDMISLNRSDGWDGLGGYESIDAELVLEEELQLWNEVGKPILVTSKGAESLAGEMKLPSVQWSESYQMEMLGMQERIWNQVPALIGEQVSFADFQMKEGLTTIDVQRSGVFTRNRQPKMAAYFLRDRWKEPVGK